MALNEYIDETIDDLDLASFNIQGKLCPKIWDGDDLKDIVRRRLLDIAQEFYDFLKLDRGVLSDIVFVGSLSNYNWSRYSDIDVHLVMDFSHIDATPELLRSYFDLKKDNWKSKHDIRVYGFDVELYVEDTATSPVSEGRYSILTASWINKPSRTNFHINKLKVQLKAETFIDAVKEVAALKELGNPERAFEYAKKLYDKVYDYRSAGLQSSGEFSTENIVFKALRRNGTIDELRELKDSLYDEMFTLGESDADVELFESHKLFTTDQVRAKSKKEQEETDMTSEELLRKHVEDQEGSLQESDDVFAQGKFDPDAHPKSTSEVTKMLDAMGEHEIKLSHGRGYYFFSCKKGMSGDTSNGTNVYSWGSTSVYVYNVSELTFRQWWNSFKSLQNDSELTSYSYK